MFLPFSLLAKTFIYFHNKILFAVAPMLTTMNWLLMPNLIKPAEFGLTCAWSMSTGKKGVKGAQPGPVLSWMQRARIAVCAARGLEFLHEKADPRVVHRDIKSSNILLFDHDVAKIGDFDISNQAPDMAARLHSTRVLGTFGYHAPEYVFQMWFHL